MEKDIPFLQKILRDDGERGWQLTNRDIEARTAVGRRLELERIFRRAGRFDKDVLAHTADLERDRDVDRRVPHDDGATRHVESR